MAWAKVQRNSKRSLMSNAISVWLRLYPPMPVPFPILERLYALGIDPAFALDDRNQPAV